MVMGHIEANLKLVRNRINDACRRSHRDAEEITLVAVTKTIDTGSIKTAIGLGIKHFGENRIQEAVPKIESLSQYSNDITWHMIGHLQTNKVKQAIHFFDIIESVDSLKLAMELNNRTDKALPVLLQVNVAEEGSKNGFSVVELEGVFEDVSSLPKLNISGLMTIAPLVANPEEVRPVFRKLRELRDKLGLEHLSMGMTDDFEVAIEEGATILRIGRAIFGERSISCK